MFNFNGYPPAHYVRTARATFGVTTLEAAKLVHSTPRAWQHWEAGTRRMHPAFWELFLLKIGARKLG